MTQGRFRESEKDRLARELAFAYEIVFGREGERSAEQERVLSDFERMGFGAFPLRTNAEDSAGRIDNTRLAINSGKQEFLMHVRANLVLASQLQRKPKE